MAIGDSTTASNYRIQRVVELSNLRPADAQITLIGTNGSSPILHEGRPGWTVKKYYQPFGADAIENPFVENEGDKFDAAYYISTSGQPVPEVISWTLGINDVFSATSDIELQQRMDVFLSQLSQMIGIEEAMDVTSWKEVDASIVHLVSLPILPYSQDGFAPLMWPYKQNIPVSASGQSRARYWRNIVGASLRMIEYFKDKESDNIFLMPFNSSIDIINNAPKKIVTPWNRHARGIVRRDSNDVHPLDAGGNNQLGDVEYALLNWLVVTGRITSHE